MNSTSVKCLDTRCGVACNIEHFTKDPDHRRGSMHAYNVHACMHAICMHAICIHTCNMHLYIQHASIYVTCMHTCNMHACTQHCVQFNKWKSNYLIIIASLFMSVYLFVAKISETVFALVRKVQCVVFGIFIDMPKLFYSE